MRYPTNNFETDWNTTAGYSFGDKTDYGYHEADDLNINAGGNADLGQPLYAVADGEVTSVHEHTTQNTFGKHLHLKFNTDGKDYWAHYAHCQTIMVKEGQSVKQGDQIATVGNTGTVYAHCHFAIKNQPTGVDGIAKTKEDLNKWESPIQFIKNRLGQSSSQQVIIDTLREQRDTNWDLYNKELDAHNETKKKVGGLQDDVRKKDARIQEYLKSDKELHEELTKADDELDEAIGDKIKAQDLLRECEITLEIVCQALDIPLNSKRDDIAQRIANIKAPEDVIINYYEKIISEMWNNLFKGKKAKSVIDRIKQFIFEIIRR